MNIRKPTNLPWRLASKFIARSKGFIDPFTVYARLQNFSQPSEVAEPIELLRAGAIMHARGLINSRAIQHNLDWVWPYWVEKQFNPEDSSFIPRAFSITHINLTHRNWSALGLPGFDELPIVDPRGLLTPFWDSWSIDCWFLGEDGSALLPSREESVEQLQSITDDRLFVTTNFENDNVQMALKASVAALEDKREIQLDQQVSLLSSKNGWLIVSLRPYNPEGVSFIDTLKLADSHTWLINDKDTVQFDRNVSRHHASNYEQGDVFIHLKDRLDDVGTSCNVGMVTAAAMFKIEAKSESAVQIRVPLNSRGSSEPDAAASDATGNTTTGTRLALGWNRALSEKTELQLPEAKFESLYDSAIATLILCSPGETYAGPYTYKRFWYRDAVYIAHGLLSTGMISRARGIIERFPQRQKRNGYFHSQDGEWDSNGEVLWVYKRLLEITNSDEEIFPWSVVADGAQWIIDKRMGRNSSKWPGLLPAGFSAEHLGPNDFYYWDDYWAVAGLESAAWIAMRLGRNAEQRKFSDEAKSLRDDIETSLTQTKRSTKQNGIPAAAGRRMDSGAIGSVVASYPLRHYQPRDINMLNTIDYLRENCFVDNGFFQDMIHSGINAYLSLHVAQVLLRAGDPSFFSIVRKIAELATPTGHWPEAVHPATRGGCMGDGHHAWAAVEWIAMMRSLFIIEEEHALVLGAGIIEAWTAARVPCRFGPSATAFGKICVMIGASTERSHGTCTDDVVASWNAEWFVNPPPKLIIAVPGYQRITIEEPEPEGELMLEPMVTGAHGTSTELDLEY